MLSYTEKLLFGEAFVFLMGANMAIYLFSNPFLFKMIKNEQFPSANDIGTIESIKKAIGAAKVAWFGMSKCYAQAIAATWMLKRRKIASQLFLGVTKDEEGKVVAHAWTKVNSIFVSGEQQNMPYNIIFKT